MTKINYYIIIIIILLSSQQKFSQNNEIEDNQNASINVFIDCARCDMNYIIEEIQFVNFVRDRKASDVHVLITEQRTGSNGRKYYVNFIGLNNSSKNDTLTYSTNATDSDDDERRKMVKTLKLGLLPYISKLPITDNIRISYKKPKSSIQNGVHDAWNNWVMRINLNTYMRGESSYNSFRGWGGVSARRVTAETKFYTSFSGEYEEKNFDYDDVELTKISRTYRYRLSYIKAVNNYWSYGLWANYYSSSYRNISNSYFLAPGIEYNFFPYRESNRRQLRIGYRIWSRFNDYIQQTIYFKDSEYLFEQSLSVNLEVIQPWGNIDLTLRGSNYLHDFSKNSLAFYGGVELQVIKGLGVRFRTGIEAIHDQITLPISSASIDEVLLQQRELATNFEYWGSIGFSYTFGSIFNNIVNPRFGD